MKLNSFKWILLIVTIIPCIKGQSCPSGYQFIYNQCVVISTQIQCPYGSVLDGQRCIQSNGNCYSYCNQGYVLINNGCVPIYHQPCATTCQPLITQTITACQPIQPITPAPCSTAPTPTITTRAPATITRTIITCPNNMVWNSTQCVRESTNLINNIGITNVVNNKNIIHQPVNVNINNSNTVHLKTSDGTVVRIDQAGNHTSTYKPPLTAPTTIKLPEENCCTIISPRECTYRTNWRCDLRRYVRCDDFCTHKTICLVRGRNCSRCVTDMSLCPSYCYEPDCIGGDCRFYDQQEYCQEFPGSDGCF